MGIIDALSLLLLLLAFSAAATPLTASNPERILSHPTAANCLNKCGHLTFDFPFGIGAGCFRQPDFELICSNATGPSRLFLRDGVTEVLDHIYASMLPHVTISHDISTRPDVDIYNMSLATPASSFLFVFSVITTRGCDWDTYLVSSSNKFPPVKICRVTCPAEGITDTVPGGSCDNTGEMGCCSKQEISFDNSMMLQIVRRSRVARPWNPSQNKIRVTIDTLMAWTIIDEPTCAAAMDDKAGYACVSKKSDCQNSDEQYSFDRGYSCSCGDGTVGNPYILDGCTPDYGYSPIERKATCSRRCGNIEVPFPFGLEEGCWARKEFQLNCINNSSSELQMYFQTYVVKRIDVMEGLMDMENRAYNEQEMPWISGNEKNTVFISSRLSARMKWVVASLTCKQAQQHNSTYACVSINSRCLGVNASNNYVGYHCKCTHGFTGNPYVRNGCQDIDECKTRPGICQGICHNTEGSYTCDKCPGKKEYDITKNKCTSTRKQVILLGFGIGLSAAFGAVLLGLSSLFVIRRWRRDIQKQLRKKYFIKNHGLLLEQLISSDENASHKTKIFSLEELEKATDNFDDTRIVGRGGHGMVYKGILSDQRVVAIKKSMVIQQGEIDQFINEVAILSQINHRNIVKLFGCCLETEVPLLVYDFISNGSLFETLHSGSSNNFCLSWDDRLRIAAESAGALYYLHSAASISVFHRDVKSSNILLDANYTAKVSDFGTSRLVPIDRTHVSTHIKGTFGYFDPEYYRTGHLNEKSDVYSFGVVLLELLLGRKPIVASESGTRQSLYSYFLEELKEKPIKEIIDAQVEEEATEEEINNVASIAEMCLRFRGEERPTMKEVEMSLQFLRTRKLNSCHVAPQDHMDMQSLLRVRTEAGILSHSSNTIVPVSINSRRCYSLEQEFMSSASLPR